MGLHPRATTPTSLTCEQASDSNVLKRANAPILACGASSGASLSSDGAQNRFAHTCACVSRTSQSMNPCVETIYQSIFIQATGTLRKEIASLMRQGRARRRPAAYSRQVRPRFKDPMVMISERPASVEDRALPGHWEGDLIIGAKGQSAVGTLVERSTRYTLLLYLPNGHTAVEVQDAIIDKLADLPHSLRLSLTWDQGSELAQHRKIASELGLDVYFCDPHSPWRRGTNENTNGLLRQYMPKGTDLSLLTEADPGAIADQQGDRPRKTLNWDTPKQRLEMLLRA